MSDTKFYKEEYAREGSIDTKESSVYKYDIADIRLSPDMKQIYFHDRAELDCSVAGINHRVNLPIATAKVNADGSTYYDSRTTIYSKYKYVYLHKILEALPQWLTYTEGYSNTAPVVATSIGFIDEDPNAAVVKICKHLTRNFISDAKYYTVRDVLGLKRRLSAAYTVSIDVELDTFSTITSGNPLFFYEWKFETPLITLEACSNDPDKLPPIWKRTSELPKVPTYKAEEFTSKEGVDNHAE